jgi:hypothetical protein
MGAKNGAFTGGSVKLDTHPPLQQFPKFLAARSTYTTSNFNSDASEGP